MFRRLAEAFQNEADNKPTNQQSYVNNQASFFNALPNMFLSPTSGLNGFNIAIQSVNSQGTEYNPPVIKNPNNIFIQDSSSNLNNIAQQCETSSIDQLIAMKNPNAVAGCGWLYTPPNKGSPYPVLSKGFIGDSNGPFDNFNPPDHKKYFFDLQLAKKQMLLDKCRALKSCTDVDNDPYNGVCGYCTDTNQGVPINANGQPLYGGDPLGTCSAQSVITSGNSCPPPSSGGGPAPIVDKTCDPVNGRLSAACLYNQVIAGGCSDNGTLAIALANPSNPSNYIANIMNGDSVKIYNRVANPPLNLDIFSKGATTASIALNQVRQLAGNTAQPSNTALGAASRDLCLQSGAIRNYDFCNDLTDSTLSPFDMNCLQQIFKKMGGQPSGMAYPNTNTMPTYNSMVNLGNVKQYINTMISNINSGDYNTQRTAMMQFLGITPEKLIQRVPYQQGVEVIWMFAFVGQSNKVMGILKRTIESDIVQFGGSTALTPIPQLASTYPGFTQYSAMIQMFDVRAPTNFTTNFTVVVDDSFYIAANQPANVAELAFSSTSTNQQNLFSNMELQGPTSYTTTQCFNYYGNTPNITKIYYTDSSGGGHTFQLAVNGCTGSPSFSSPYYSLTLESGAPYLNFELLADGSAFDDIRNPTLFSQLITQTGLELHNRPEERNSVPLNKGFIRLTNSISYYNLTNIAYQAWTTVSFAFRLQSMPVKDGLFSFFSPKGHVILYAVPINGSQAQLRVITNFTANVPGFANGDGGTPIKMQVGSWYYLEVAQNGQGYDIYCDSVNNIVNNSMNLQNFSVTNNGQPITTTYNNGLFNVGVQSCSLGIGGLTSGITSLYNSTFIFDVAWAHFYDYYISAANIVKECTTGWKFTQFPDSVNTYKTIGT